MKTSISRFIVELQQKNPATISQLNRLIRAFPCPINEISRERIVDYIVGRRASGIKPSTINREITLLKQLFAWAKLSGYISDNPTVNIQYESGVAKRVRHITTEEEEKLISGAAPWMQAIIQFATSTGMRRGEILGLKKSDINLQDKTATINMSKNGEPRIIPLTRRALEAISKAFSLDEKVFGGKDGRSIKISTLEGNFGSATKRAGIRDLHFHDLRHTYATRLVRAGIDLYVVQCLLGHKNPAMTQRYAHHSIESLRKAVEKI